MRKFAAIKLGFNDVPNLLHVDEKLPEIDIVVAEVSKSAAARDTKKLADAMSKGYFKFASQSKIQQNVKVYLELSEVSKRCIYLDDYDESQIQQMIDLILLCQTNKIKSERKVDKDEDKEDDLYDIITDPEKVMRDIEEDDPEDDYN